jgi:hypothetical protein
VDCQRSLTPPVGCCISWALSIHSPEASIQCLACLPYVHVRTPLLLSSDIPLPRSRQEYGAQSSRPETSSASSTVVYQRPGDGRLAAGVRTPRRLERAEKRGAVAFCAYMI